MYLICIFRKSLVVNRPDDFCNTIIEETPEEWLLSKHRSYWRGESDFDRPVIVWAKKLEETETSKELYHTLPMF